MPPALAIFVKTPGLSPIKTRLAHGIGHTQALHFHHLAARATAEVVSACGGAVQPYWALAEDKPLAYASWTGFPAVTQGTGTLGDRLYRVHARLQEKHGSALMIGTDIPQITPALILEAVDTLSRPQVDHVLGPASDGGFWLFGSKRKIDRDTWNEVPYSTADTARTLRQKLADTGHLESLTMLTDIDKPDNLQDLRQALSGMSELTSTQHELFAWVSRITDP